ncbi:hypothetical protein A33M_0947 [Rhodovulum sp. PH10]|nr:hypothetical protein A33M_0947 [Rhodovulum sp. PH10]
MSGARRPDFGSPRLRGEVGGRSEPAEGSACRFIGMSIPLPDPVR